MDATPPVCAELPPPLGTLKIVASWNHTCVLRSGEALICWGRDDLADGLAAMVQRLPAPAIDVEVGLSTESAAEVCVLEASGVATCARDPERTLPQQLAALRGGRAHGQHLRRFRLLHPDGIGPGPVGGGVHRRTGLTDSGPPATTPGGGTSRLARSGPSPLAPPPCVVWTATAGVTAGDRNGRTCPKRDSSRWPSLTTKRAGSAWTGRSTAGGSCSTVRWKLGPLTTAARGLVRAGEREPNIRVRRRQRPPR